jgi:uncharacterized membrane protein
VAHLISNGDLGSIILFGSFLLWAAYDRISLKHRADRGAPASCLTQPMWSRQHAGSPS